MRGEVRISMRQGCIPPRGVAPVLKIGVLFGDEPNKVVMTADELAQGALEWACQVFKCAPRFLRVLP